MRDQKYIKTIEDLKNYLQDRQKFLSTEFVFGGNSELSDNQIKGRIKELELLKIRLGLDMEEYGF